MLTLVEGKPGCGKSNWLVKKMRDYVNSGRKVITNIQPRESGWVRVNPRAMELIEYHPQEVVEGQLHVFQQYEWLMEAAKWRGPVKNADGDVVEMGPVFIIDEAHFVYPSGTVRSGERRALDFWTMHRHYYCDGIIATQRKEQVRAGLLRLCAEHYLLRGTQTLGLFGQYRWSLRDGYMGPVIKSSTFNWWDKKAFALYFSTVAGNTVAAKTKGSNFFLKKRFILLYCLLGYIGYQQYTQWSKGNPFQRMGSRGEESKPPEPVASKDSAAATPQSPPEQKVAGATVPGLAKKEEPAPTVLGGLVTGMKNPEAIKEPAPSEWRPRAFTKYPCAIRWGKDDLRTSSFMLTSQGWRIEISSDGRSGCEAVATNKAGTVAYAEKW